MFIPKRVIFEKGSLDTEVGENIYNKIKDNPNIEIINATSNKLKLIYLVIIYLINIDQENKH